MQGHIFDFSIQMRCKLSQTYVVFPILNAISKIYRVNGLAILASLNKPVSFLIYDNKDMYVSQKIYFVLCLKIQYIVENCFCFCHNVSNRFLCVNFGLYGIGLPVNETHSRLTLFVNICHYI